MPVPDIYTDKYWLDYQGPAGKHTTMFRFLPVTSTTDAITRITAVANAMKAYLHTSTSFYSIRRQAQGSNVSFPVQALAIVGTAAGTFTADMYPRFVSWVGRDSGGNRLRVTLNGIIGVPDLDYRDLTAESTAVGAVLTALRATGPSIVTIAGFVPFWNDYANKGYNAYFQRKRRRG